MKKHYFLFGVLLASSLTIAWQHSSESKGLSSHMFSSGGQSGLTGAPGENNCTQCHSGSTLDGTIQNSFTLLDGVTPVTTYTPGDTYTVSLALASAPAKSGFSSTVLDGTDAMAGNLIGAGIGGTQNFSSAGRDYVSHTAVSNTSSTRAWTWIAPTTNVGPVTFYVASNETNDNGATSGDMIYLSEHIVNPTSAAGIDEKVGSKVVDFNASFSQTNSTLNISYGSLINGTSTLNLIDLTGQSVMTQELNNTNIGINNEKVLVPEHIKNGMYVVHFFVNNVATSKTVSIQR